MPNTTWKSFERRLARSYGQERTQGVHGPDFVIDIAGVSHRAEVKKRARTSGLATVIRWLMGRDILFVGFRGERDDDALVVMRKQVFDKLWHNQLEKRSPDGMSIAGGDILHDMDERKLLDLTRRIHEVETKFDAKD
jgi:hypothetical protein